MGARPDRFVDQLLERLETSFTLDTEAGGRSLREVMVTTIRDAAGSGRAVIARAARR